MTIVLYRQREAEAVSKHFLPDPVMCNGYMPGLQYANMGYENNFDCEEGFKWGQGSINEHKTGLQM